jgi:hypothetical protein
MERLTENAPFARRTGKRQRAWPNVTHRSSQLRRRLCSLLEAYALR